jgi:hypothetical protein
MPQEGLKNRNQLDPAGQQTAFCDGNALEMTTRRAERMPRSLSVADNCSCATISISTASATTEILKGGPWSRFAVT